MAYNITDVCLIVDINGNPISFPGGGGGTPATPLFVELVDGAGNPVPVTPVQRVTTVQRVITATTTNIAAGAKSYAVLVVAAASAASPTLDGVAVPAGASISYSADWPDTLEAAAIATVLGDDVIITTVV